MEPLIVGEIVLAGFGSYGPESQTLTLGGGGPLAVTGDNGSGKSTMASKGLTWVLEGKCPPERMGSGTRMLSGKGIVNDDCDEAAGRVTLLSWPAREPRYRIERSRKRTGADNLIIMEVGPDGAETPLDGGQATIDGIIGADYDVFVRTVVRGQNDVWNFAEATDARKREVLDTVSGAEALGTAYVKAKDLRVKAQGRVDLYASRAADAERRADEVDLETIGKQVDGWERDQGTKVEQARADVAALEQAEQAAVGYDAEAAQGDAQRVALDAERPALDLAPYAASITAAREDADRLAREKAVLDADWHKLEHLGTGATCPTCGQIVAEGAPTAAKKSALLQPMADADQAHHGAADYLQQCEMARHDAAVWLDDELAKWQTKRDAIPGGGPATAPAAQQATTAARRRLGDLESATNPYAAAVEQAETARASAVHEAACLREAERCAQREHDQAAAWETALSPKGVRAHLAEAALAAIEIEANKWLSVLSSGRMTVAFPSTREVGGRTKEEIQTILTFRKPDGTEVQRDMLAFSGGQKRRINFAVDLGVAAAFERGGALALSLLVLDEEVFSGMDEEGKAAVAQAIHNTGVADVVCIDHDPRLSGVIDRHVETYLDDDGYSRLREAS